jgi:hypothetical protein
MCKDAVKLHTFPLELLRNLAYLLLAVIIVAVVLAWLSLFSCLEVVYESDKLLLSCFCTCVKL